VGAEIFTLFGRIVTNAKQTTGDLGKVDAAAAKTGASMSLGFAKANAAIQKNAGAIRAVGMAMTAVGASIAAFSVGAVKFSVDLNEGMANVATLIPRATERVLEFRTEIMRLSVETGKAMSDLTEGLYQVISAFGDAADTEEKLNIVTRAGVAGRAQTVEALNLLSAVTKGYGDTSAAALRHVADLAFATVRMGQTTFPELASSMGLVISMANDMGISQEELFAVMATGTGVTGTANLVVTQFRGVLNALMNPQKEMIVLLEKHDYASGKAMLADLGLIGTLQLIAKEAKAGGHQMIDYISQVEALPIVLALTGAQTDVYVEKLGGMTKATGEADAAFSEQTEGINATGFALAQFRRRVETTITRIGDGLVPVLGDLLSAGEPILNWIEAQMRLHPQLTKGLTLAAAGFGALMLALGPLLIALPSVMTMLATIAGAGGLGAVGASAASLAAAGGPIALVVIAIGALAAAIWGAKKAWDAYIGVAKPITAEQRAINKEASDAYEIVERLGKKAHLATEEHKKYHAALQDLAAIYPEVVKSYDEQGRATFNLTELVKKARQAHEDYVHALRVEANLERLTAVADLVAARQAVADQKQLLSELKAEQEAAHKYSFGYVTRMGDVKIEADYRREFAETSAELRRRIGLVEELEKAEKARRTAASGGAAEEPSGRGGEGGGGAEAGGEGRTALEAVQAYGALLKAKLDYAAADADDEQRIQVLREYVGWLRRAAEKWGSLAQQSKDPAVWNWATEVKSRLVGANEELFKLDTSIKRTASDAPMLAAGFDTRLDDLTEAITEARTKMEELASLGYKDTLPWQDAVRELNALLDEQIRLQAELGTLRREPVVSPVMPGLPPMPETTEQVRAALVGRLAELQAEWDGASLARRETIVQERAEIERQLALLEAAWDNSGNQILLLWQHTAEKIQDAFASAIKRVMLEGGKLSGFLSGIWDAIKTAFAEMVATMIAKWVMLKAAMSLGFSLPFLQHGGIVTQPTMAMIGESGPEAVIPLTQTMAASVSPLASPALAFAGAAAGPGLGGVMIENLTVELSADALDAVGVERLGDRLVGPLGRALEGALSRYWVTT